MRWICPDQLFDGKTLRGGMALGVLDGTVQSILPQSEIPQNQQRDLVRGTVTAGFVDLQVNGGGGVLLNNTPTAQGLSAISAAHRNFGTVAILPTVITDTPEIMVRAVDAVLAQNQPSILGLHIEGPHIAPARRGTHDLRHIRPLDDATFAQIARLCAAGLTAKITLAPEAVQPDQVRKLVAMGAIVSIGHSDATADQVKLLLAEGAQCFTHLFNAMSPMLGRASGVTGAAISSDAYCGIICDGHHISDDMLALAFRARPVDDRMFLVSDAMATVGGPAQFDLYGQTISLDNGKLVNSEGALAGAHLTMQWALQRAIQCVHITPESALKMAVTNPSTLILRLDLAVLLGRATKDILILGSNWELLGFCDNLTPLTK